MSTLCENIRRALRSEFPTPFLAPLLSPINGKSLRYRCARPALDRILQLSTLLKRGERFNASTAARRFGTSTKTIQRDLDFIRDQVGGRLQWNWERNSYELTGPFKFKNGGRP